MIAPLVATLFRVTPLTVRVQIVQRLEIIFGFVPLTVRVPAHFPS